MKRKLIIIMEWYNFTSCLILQQIEYSTIERWKMGYFNLTRVSAYRTSNFLIVIIHRVIRKSQKSRVTFVATSGHFRVALCLSVIMCLRSKPFIWKYVPPPCLFSYMQTNSFSYEGFCTRTRFEAEAQGKLNIFIN